MSLWKTVGEEPNQGLYGVCIRGRLEKNAGDVGFPEAFLRSSAYIYLRSAPSKVGLYPLDLSSTGVIL